MKNNMKRVTERDKPEKKSYQDGDDDNEFAVIVPLKRVKKIKTGKDTRIINYDEEEEYRE
jgi:hypothetical protein